MQKRRIALAVAHLQHQIRAGYPMPGRFMQVGLHASF